MRVNFYNFCAALTIMPAHRKNLTNSNNDHLLLTAVLIDRSVSRSRRKVKDLNIITVHRDYKKFVFA